MNLEHGNPGRALELLTGAPSRRISFYERMDQEALARTLTASAAARRPMVLTTREVDVQAPLNAEHAYAVLEFTADKGLKLYNPWGTERHTRPLASLIHEVPLAA